MRIFGAVRHQGDMGISPVSYYRVALPLRAINELTAHEARAYDQIGLYNMFSLAIQNGMNPEDTVDGYDIYLISRLYREQGSDEYVNSVHEKGGLVVFDTDDDLTEEYRHLDGKGNEFSSMPSKVDLVTVSTPYLADHMEKYTNHRPVVLPNHVDFGWFAKTSLEAYRKHEGTTIGVIGTQTHYDDWKFLEEPFARISEEYDDVTVLTAGFQPDFLQEYTYLNPVPYDFYPGLMRQFDIVCCALNPEDGFNKSKCVVGGTLISTTNGLKRMEDVEGGDVVHTTTGQESIIETFEYSDREVVEVTTELGYTITGTPNHKVRCAGRWVKLEDLASLSTVELHPMEFSRDYVWQPFNGWAVRRSDTDDVPLETESCPQVRIDENYGLLIGAVLGDGHVSRAAVRITVNEQDFDWAKTVMRAARAIGLNPRVEKHSAKGCVNIGVHCTRFTEFLSHIDVWGGSNGRTGAHDAPKNFYVPDVILQSPKSVIRAFLRGLFESDGHATKEMAGVGFCTKSERLCKEVQILLTGFGITCKRYTSHNNAYSSYYHHLKLRSTEAREFAKKIGFISERKSGILADRVSRPQSNAALPMAWEDSVKTVETSRANVYDATVDQEHHYLANGFVSHNSSIKALEAMSAARKLSNGKIGGAVAVCTDMKVYRRTVNDGHNGVLVDNDDWYEVLKELIEDERARNRIAYRGHRWVRDNRDIRQGYIRWKRAYLDLLGE